MSHFVVGVIANREEVEKDLEKTLFNKLKKYDENTVVEKYKKQCFCIYEKAKENAIKLIEKETGKTIKDFRNDIAAIEDFKERDKKWEELTEDYFIRLDQLVLEQIVNTKPKKDCENCNGDGEYTTDYNPNSKWDWYEIGGRWEGVINNKNVVSVQETIDYIKGGGSFFALVSSDGDWFEKGEMGWFGCSSNNIKEETWKENSIVILDQFNSDDFVVVVVDCHI